MTAAEQSLRRPAPPGAQSLRRQYAEEAARPLYCLLFLFPLVATYEFGALILRPEVGPGQQLVAHSLIQRLLGWFGASGLWLPAAALVLTLLIWHLLRRYPWRIRGWVLPLMMMESLLLTVPLFVLWQVMRVNGSAPVALDLRRQIVLALGAGIYEELVFRLYLITGLTWLLAKLLRVSKKVSGPLVIVFSAMVFAASFFIPWIAARMVGFAREMLGPFPW